MCSAAADQPMSWNEINQERDGDDSGARIEVFGSMKASEDMDDARFKT